MEYNEPNFISMQYNKDILLISKCLHNNKIEENEIEDEMMYKYCNKKNYFNTKGTKILKEEDFINIISILYEYVKIDDYIFLLFEKMNIYLIKIIINGFIDFNIKNEEQKNKVFSIIHKIIPLILKRDYILFIYNKLSKIFRLELRNKPDSKNLKLSFNKFRNIFDIWKIIFNYEDDIKANEKYIQLFGNNNIIIKINNINKSYESTKININLVKSPLFDINTDNEDFVLIKIYNSKEEFLEVKLKDIIKDNDDIIYSIRFVLNNNSLSYIINNNENYKGEIKTDFIYDTDIKIMEIMKNFYGKLLSINFIRIYKNKQVLFYTINPDVQNINVIKEYKKETFSDIYRKFSENETWKIKENIDINLENNLFLNTKYYPENPELISNIKYFGGFEAFIPMFKIIKYFAKYIEDKNIIIRITKDILETIINKIHISKKNLNNFYEIIIPLTGALKTIIDELSEKERDILLKNNIINILYLYILTAPVSNLAKDVFREIIHIPNEVLIPKINYEDKIFIKDLSKISYLDWYFFILFTHFELNLLVLNDFDEVPKNILELLSKLIIFTLKDQKLTDELIVLFQIFVGIMQYQYQVNIEGLNKFPPIKELSGIINGVSVKKNDLSLLCLFILKIIFEFKNLNIIKNIDNNSFYIKFIELFLDLKNIFKINLFDKRELKNNKLYLKRLYIQHLKNYPENKKYILKLLDENEDKIEFISKEEIQINRFIDYKKQFRKILKEQFLFNNFWSNKKLFFDEKSQEGKLKYQQKNYYTTNFQRPIIMPLLDYKYQYPSFSEFIDEKNLYSIKENEDDYNFNLESKQFDDILERIWKFNFEIIEKESSNKIIICDACLIKQTHHIKGKIFFENKNKIKNFYFISYNYRGLGTAPNCNSNNLKSNLCFGSLFPCPEKDCFIKIKINIDDIRFIIKRIYFYRKSAIEIFTKNKSYYFNFADNPSMKNYIEKMGENNCNYFFTVINASFKHKFFPLSFNKEILGYIDLYAQNYFDEKGNVRKSMKKTFYDHLLRHWRDKENKYSKANNDVSTFDVLILINLISNRSYIDLYQYPIFPLLHYYDKKIIEDKEEENITIKFDLINRKLANHIGFQTETEMGKTRKQEYINLYNVNFEEKEGEGENKTIPYYFNTHYSNALYVSNFLLRLFPYCFISIESQEDGLDFTDKLFYSIENNFYTISYLKSDIRELIPEFFYFPEMMINLNKLNFEKKFNGQTIENVKMPSNFNELNQGENYEIVKYIEFMKNSLEKETKLFDIFSWIKLIFGTEQMYNDNKKKDLLFRPESYITLDDKKLNEYIQDNIIMNSTGLGLIPLQTVYDEFKLDKKKISQKKLDNKEIEKIMITNQKFYIIELDNIKNDFNITNKEYNFQDNFNNSIKILSNDLGKIEIYVNDALITEYYNQKDSVRYIDYNKRLNMFITTSLDGYACLYSFPNKILNVIKHPNEGYFDYVLLGANPFPFIVAYDKINQELYSYSINGIFITKVKIIELIQNVNLIKIFPIFDTNGGTHKDVLVFHNEKNNILINLPFFEIEK